MGCFAMTETGHGSNVQALGTVATYDAGDAGVRDHHARTPEARKDYIGNAARPRRARRRLRPARGRRRDDEGVHAFVVPIREDGRPLAGVRIEDDGAKMGLNGVDNGRLWFDQVRVPREALLNRFADVYRGRHLLQRHREPEPSLLHDARHPGPGPGLRRRRRHQRQQGRAGHRDPLRAQAPAVRGDARRTRRSCCSTTGSTSAGCSRSWPTPTRCTSRRRWSPASATRCSPARWTTRSPSASSSRAPRAPRRSAPGTRPTPSRSAARRAAAPATWPRTGSRRSRPTPTCSPRSRATTRSCSSWSPRGCSPTTPRASRTSTSSAWSGSSPGSRSRPWSSGRACTSCVERVRDLLPGGDEWDQEAGLLDPQYQLAMLRFREEHMLAGVARRLKRGIDEGMNPGEVFSLVQDHVIARGPRARRAAGARGVRREGRDAARTATTRSRSTCSATCTRSRTIEADRAWFMEHGRLTGSRSKAISREINELCRKVRPLARDLVDAFGVPGGDAAQQGPARLMRRVRLPGLGGWSRRPAVGLVLRLDRRAPDRRRRALGGRHPAATCACSTPPRPRSAASPTGARVLDVPCGGGVAAARAAPRPGRRLRRRRHLPDDARPDRERGRASAASPTRSTTRLADVGALPFEDAVLRPGRLLHRAALLPRPGAARSSRWRGCSGPAA